MTRGTREVFEDHLRKALEGRVEEDLATNYAEDVVFILADGVHRGLEAGRRLARRLERELPEARFEYVAKVVEGDVAFLEWTGRGGGRRVDDGADTFVVRDGRIRVQTIHYTVRDA